MFTKDTCSEIWGDGIKFNSKSTYWDDFNIYDNDGWSSTWNVETGWKWSGGSTTSADIWVEIWGDGVKFNTNSTYWDDGNLSDNDGWSSLCKIESNEIYWYWILYYFSLIKKL